MGRASAWVRDHLDSFLIEVHPGSRSSHREKSSCRSDRWVLKLIKYFAPPDRRTHLLPVARLSPGSRMGLTPGARHHPGPARGMAAHATQPPWVQPHLPSQHPFWRERSRHKHATLQKKTVLNFKSKSWIIVGIAEIPTSES